MYINVHNRKRFFFDYRRFEFMLNLYKCLFFNTFLLINTIFLGVLPDLEAYCSIDSITLKFKCSMCYKMFKRKDDLLNHLEGTHFLNSFSHSCKLCTALFNTRKKLQQHKHAY